MITRLKSVTSHSGFRRYGANTAWLFAEKIIRMVAGLFIGIWIARYLGPDQFGLLNYVISFAAIFGIIGTFGLDGIIIRELVKDKTKRDIILGTAFWLRVIGSLLVMLILVIASYFTSNDSMTDYYILLIAFSSFFNTTLVISSFFESEVQSKNSVKVNISMLIISSILKIIFILFNFPLIAFVYLVVIEAMILAVGYISIYSKDKRTVWQWKLDKSTALQMLKDGWPLMISFMMVTIYMQSDIIMIKELLNVEAVGIYAAATRLSVAWYFIPSIIASSLFPALINAKKISESLYYARLTKLLTLMIWMGIAIAIPMTFLSDWLIMILYGEAYNGAGIILSIHIWAAVFVFANSAINQWYVNENLQFISMIFTGIGAILNLVLNYLLIPIYGIVGSAIATIISYFIASFLCLLFHKETRKVFFIFIKSFNIFNLMKLQTSH